MPSWTEIDAGRLVHSGQRSGSSERRRTGGAAVRNFLRLEKISKGIFERFLSIALHDFPMAADDSIKIPSKHFPY